MNSTSSQHPVLQAAKAKIQSIKQERKNRLDLEKRVKQEVNAEMQVRIQKPLCYTRSTLF